MVASSDMQLLSTWNDASSAKELNFSFINFSLNNHIWPVGYLNGLCSSIHWYHMNSKIDCGIKKPDVKSIEYVTFCEWKGEK